MLKPVNLKFHLGKSVLLTVLLAVLLGFSAPVSYAQQITVKGKVLDEESQQGLPGVSIYNARTNKGISVSDENGNIFLQVEKGTSLLFRFLGYNDKTVRINNADVITVRMSSSYNTLEEAVVVGYQTRQRETVTGSVAVISGDDLKDVPVSSVQELLQGKVAGLNIQNNTGAPGFRGTVAIRGISQLSVSGSGDQKYLASSDPLLVIDNVPVQWDGGISQAMLQPGAATGPLALIPPDDIESIEVLKDAQSTALYGSRGANGVIVITTKRGNSPVPVVSVNSSVFLNLAPPLHPTWGGNALERYYRINAILNYSNDLDHARDMLEDLQILTDSLNPFYNNSTDWQGLFYRSTVNTTHNIQVSGGNPKLNYKANMGYQMNQGIIKNTGFNKYSLNMQLHMQPSDKLRIGTQLFGALGQKQRGNGGGLTGNGAGDAFTSSLYPGPSYFVSSPQFAGYESNMDDNNTVNIRGHLDVDYEIIPNVRLNTVTSYDYYTDTRDQFKPAFANNDQTLLYGFTGRRSEFNSRNGINYNYSSRPDDSDEGHNVLASLFTEINIRTNEQHIRDMRNGPSDFYWGPRGYSPRFYPGNVWNDADGENTNGTLVSLRYHALSFAGLLSYNYKTKYVIDLSYRLDGNSSSGVDAKYTMNPSIGLRWNFFKENWFQDLSWLDYGSVRLTYGINSRPLASLVNALGLYTVYNPYNNSASIGPDFSLMANPGIEAEKSSQYNLGVELGLWKGRVELTYDTYYKETYNMVRGLELPRETGFDKVELNGASMVNYGHELNINIRPIVSPNPRDFQWTFGINGAINQGILTGLPKDASLYIEHQGAPYWEELALKVGRNPVSNYLYRTLGVYPTTDDVPVDPVRGVRYKSFRGNGTNYFQGGDPIWQDLNGDYFLDDLDDNVVTGNAADPKLVGGMNNTFSYRGFSLNIFCSYVYKRSLLNNAMSNRLYQFRFMSDLDNGDFNGNLYAVDELDIWRQPGDIARYPALAGYYHANQTLPFRRDQTLFQEDGSYFKINQITLSYMFPRLNFMEQWDIHMLRTYVTAYNVAMFSGYSGPNPETVSSLGRDDLTAYPSARTFALGLAIEF